MLSVLLMMNAVALGMEEKPAPEQPYAHLVQMGDFKVIINSGDLFITTEKNETPQQGSENPLLEKAEVFDHYFCDLEKTAFYDDVGQYSLVRSSLFMQLCVQASKAVGARLAAFQELLAKIKKDNFVKIGANEIITYNKIAIRDGEGLGIYDNVKVHTNKVGITKKDLCHRLLACVPTGHTKSLINGKKVRFVLRPYETDEDTIENLKIKVAREKLPPQEWKWGQEIKGEYEYYQYSGQRLLADYFFEADAEHHNMILKEFYELIKK